MNNKTYTIKHQSYIKEWKTEEVTYAELSELMGVTGDKLDNAIAVLCRIGTLVEKTKESKKESKKTEE